MPTSRASARARTLPYCGSKRNSDASSIFGGATILPGFIRLSGSNSALTAANAAFNRGPNCQATHSPRHRPSPCSPEYAPLYSRTIAAASSAIARILAAPSRRMSRIGRTCKVPTLACAYQVPLVPCFAEHLGQAVGVLGQMLERHRAVLDERHRLAVAFHRHHDVEARPCALPTTPSAPPRFRSARPRRAGRGRRSARPDDRDSPPARRRRRRRTRPAGSPRARRSTRARSPDGTRDWRAPDRSSCDRPARPPSASSRTMCCAAAIAW